MQLIVRHVERKPRSGFLTLAHFTNDKKKELEKIVIDTGDALSAIVVGARWEAVEKLLPSKDVVIITDENVFELYGSEFPPFPVIKVKPGEESKQLRVVEKLSKDLVKAGIDRNGFILAIGGGVVCDLAGFVASVYMRGIRVGYISTSLLSQVDASTGGKNGVNLGKIKNVIGNFRQPEFVICDTTMLRTLSRDEYLSGLAELIKTAVIGDADLFSILENNYAGILSRDRQLLSGLIARAIRFKGSVVAEDEKETGLRRILNFAHTYGHAIELQASFPHGFAVAAGMEIATQFSVKKGFIKSDEAARIIRLLKSYKLIPDYSIPPTVIKRLITHDKKKSGTDIHFVFTTGIGTAKTEKVPVSELIEFYRLFITRK